jgi:flavin-dependent dehydrogenase
LLRSGARFERHKVSRIRKEGDDYILDERYRCRYVVGAGGTHCPVRRAVFPEFLLLSRDDQVAALEEEFSYPSRDESCRLWLCENGLAGYSWFVPKGNGWLNVGLGAIVGYRQNGESRLREHWGHFQRKLTDLGLVRGHDFNPGGHTYYLRRPGVVGQKDRCFLVGDSAGLATRILGEGIGPAVKSGLLAARAIAAGGSYSLESISGYGRLSTGWARELLEGLLFADRDPLSAGGSRRTVRTPL